MTHRLNAILTSSRELRQLTGKAQQLATWQRQVAQLLPSALSRACRVTQVDGHKLTLTADSGVIAAKLRQMSTELLDGLQARGCEVTVIQVQVQVSLPPHSPPNKARAIGTKGKEQLNRLAETLADSPLKQALTRLARRS